MERINCEILDLRAFLMVVELGSFHRTAEALNLSQPALSRRIQKLEAAIGAPLLERTTRHVAPTAIGEDLLPLVRRMLEEFDGSLFASRDPKRRGGIVSMACLPTAAFYFLPEVIRTFSVDHPEIRFRILDLPATDGPAGGGAWRGRVRRQHHGGVGPRPYFRPAGRGPVRACGPKGSPACRARAGNLDRSRALSPDYRPPVEREPRPARSRCWRR